MLACSGSTERLQIGEAASPFRQGAPDWLRHDVPVFPVGGPDGKRPLVRRPDRITVKASKDILDRDARPAANLGFSPGPRSRLTVVDVDSSDTRWFDRALSLYGDTPLIWRTPSGGWHLAYRHNGERRRIRPIQNVPIDRLASGICVAPPSVRSGGRYEIIAGSLEDLSRLPVIRGEVAKEESRADSGCRSERELAALPAKSGERNNRLFLALLKIAARVDSLDDLLDCARTINDDYQPPLDDGEVVHVTTNAWGYQTRGENWCGRPAKAAMESESIKRLVAMSKEGGSDALALCMLLRSIYTVPGITFSLATKAMEQSQVIPGWSWKRYRRAIAILISEGLLVLAKKGGNGPGNPSKYRFGDLPKW